MIKGSLLVATAISLLVGGQLNAQQDSRATADANPSIASILEFGGLERRRPLQRSECFSFVVHLDPIEAEKAAFDWKTLKKAVAFRFNEAGVKVNTPECESKDLLVIRVDFLNEDRIVAYKVDLDYRQPALLLHDIEGRVFYDDSRHLVLLQWQGVSLPEQTFTAREMFDMSFHKKYSTWRTSTFGYAGRRVAVGEIVQGAVLELVNEFILDLSLARRDYEKTQREVMESVLKTLASGESLDSDQR